jgi:superfamily II DNA or RNA helicase
MTVNYPALWDFQQGPTEALKEVILEQSDNYRRQRFFWINGEVGSGKTYMASNILRAWYDTDLGRSGIVLAPKQVHSHWRTVLKAYGLEGVQIVTKLDQIASDQLNSQVLIIIDEIHLFQLKNPEILTIRAFVAGYKATVLGLTGRPFGKNLVDFSRMVLKILKSPDEVTGSRKEKILEYLTIFFPYHAISVSRPDIQTKYHITTTEIPIDMNDEQTAFYDFLSQRGRHLQVTDYQMAAAVDRFVDFGDKETFFIKRRKKYFTGFPSQKSLKNAKLEALKKLLAEKKGKSLIFVNELDAEKLITKEKLAISIPDGKQEELENRIHQGFEKSDVVIARTGVVTEGINLSEVDRVIWYQTPKSAVSFEQCNGRIFRGYLDRDKEVIQIFSHNTIQEELANQLAAVIRATAITNAKESEEDWYTRLKKLLDNLLKMPGFSTYEVPWGLSDDWTIRKSIIFPTEENSFLRNLFVQPMRVKSRYTIHTIPSEDDLKGNYLDNFGWEEVISAMKKVYEKKQVQETLSAPA